MDDQKSEDTKARYKFPYGDFEKIHRCGVLSAESSAGQYKHLVIESEAATLHGLIDGLKHPTPRSVPIPQQWQWRKRTRTAIRRQAPKQQRNERYLDVFKSIG
jgi:hypothetical protein